MGAENLASTGIRSLDRPTRSESLYRLCYPGPHLGPFMYIYLFIYVFIYLLMDLCACLSVNEGISYKRYKL
jgi:hypothetical protein